MNDLKESNPLLGVEYAFPMVSRIQLGGFYDYQGVTSATGHSDIVQFMGMVLRFDLAGEDSVSPYIDGKFGMGSRTEMAQSSGLKTAYGAGTGLRIPFNKMISFGPRFDIKSVPDAPDASAGRQMLMDVGMMFSFKL